MLAQCYGHRFAAFRAAGRELSRVRAFAKTRTNRYVRGGFRSS
jgi:hypothetical protein